MAGWADLRVADVMTIDPITVRAGDSLEHAEQLLRVNRISGLPVLDDEGRLVGVISQSDLLWRGDLPLSVLLRKKPTALRVGELMSSPAITVPMTASLTEAARVMRDNRVHRLVALSDEGMAVGVLSAIDYVTLFADVAERDLGAPRRGDATRPVHRDLTDSLLLTHRPAARERAPECGSAATAQRHGPWLDASPAALRPGCRTNDVPIPVRLRTSRDRQLTRRRRTLRPTGGRPGPPTVGLRR